MNSLFDPEKRNTGPNYYDILGCSPLSTTEQINTEYKVRALVYHPDKNPDNQEAHVKFKQLLEAKETLCDVSMRKKYDTWLNSGICMDWPSWHNMTTKNQSVFHWVYQKSDPALPPSTSCGADSIATVKNETVKELGDFRVSSTYKTADSGILSKFRNYQI